MRLALREAEKARGRTSPNPLVGALVVRDGKVIAKGHYERATPGAPPAPHAEVVALRAAGARARGATMVVTLEPHAHHGRTPPCVDAILDAGIARVVVGAIDPNPLVSGRGVKKLRAAGVDVEVGVLGAECERANAAFFTFMREGRARAVLKAAVTLDGMLATRSGDSRWVTGEPARALVHRWRDGCDAVLVGAGTVRADDPKLTTRTPGGRDAVRVILDSRASLPTSRAVFRQRSKAPTLVAHTSAAPASRLANLHALGVNTLLCRATKDGRVAVRDLLTKLAARGLLEVLVEGGAAVHGAFLAAGLADELRLFVAPKLAGRGLGWAALPGTVKMADAAQWTFRDATRVGDDVLLVACPAG